MADAAENTAAAEDEEVELPSLSDCVAMYDAWDDQTKDSRKLARRDREYYDNVQWSRDDVDRLKLRRQPITTNNEIAPVIDTILGEEIAKRVDPVARPRTPQHEDSARAATDALRFVKQQQELDSVKTAVAKSVFVEGIGGALKGIEDDGFGELVHKLTHIEYDRLVWDPQSRAPDFSDAAYVGIIIWRDIEDAIDDYPDKEAELRGALASEIGGTDDDTADTPRGWTDAKRKRVKIFELYNHIGDNWYRADLTKSAFLREPEKTAYLDESKQRSVCPLILVSVKVDRDGARYGLVRAFISPQDAINKRESKTLHLLNTKQVLAERDSVLDPQKAQLELAKPDGYVEVEPGALTENRFVVQTNSELASGHIALMQEARRSFERLTPASSQMQDLPVSASGRAILARQQAASRELGLWFDALRSWLRRVHIIDWLCVRQYWPEEKWLRVTDDQELNGYRFVALNRKVTRAQRMQDLLDKGTEPQQALSIAAGNMAPLVTMQVQQQMQAMQVPQEQQQQAALILILRSPIMQQVVTENQVDQMMVDIIIDETPESAVIEQEEFETFADLGKYLLVPGGMDPREFAKIIVRLSQFREKREVLAALDKGPDPQQQQLQQQAQSTQLAQAQANVAVSQTQAQLNAARAAHEKTSTQIEGASAPSEIQKNQAAAMHDAATAGARVGGAFGGIGNGPS